MKHILFFLLLLPISLSASQEAQKSRDEIETEIYTAFKRGIQAEEKKQKADTPEAAQGFEGQAVKHFEDVIRIAQQEPDTFGRLLVVQSAVAYLVSAYVSGGRFGSLQKARDILHSLGAYFPQEVRENTSQELLFELTKSEIKREGIEFIRKKAQALLAYGTKEGAAGLKTYEEIQESRAKSTADLMMAENYYDDGQDDEAQKLLVPIVPNTSALEKDRKDAARLLEKVYARKGNFQEAKKYIRQWLKGVDANLHAKWFDDLIQAQNLIGQAQHKEARALLEALQKNLDPESDVAPLLRVHIEHMLKQVPSQARVIITFPEDQLNETLQKCRDAKSYADAKARCDFLEQFALNSPQHEEALKILQGWQARQGPASPDLALLHNHLLALAIR